MRPGCSSCLLIVLYSSTTTAFVIPIVLWGTILYPRGDAAELLGERVGARKAART